MSYLEKFAWRWGDAGMKCLVGCCYSGKFYRFSSSKGKRKIHGAIALTKKMVKRREKAMGINAAEDCLRAELVSLSR